MGASSRSQKSEVRGPTVAGRRLKSSCSSIPALASLGGETVGLDDKTQTIFINGVPVPQPASLRGIKYLAYGNLTGGKTASSGNATTSSEISPWIPRTGAGQAR